MTHSEIRFPICAQKEEEEEEEEEKEVAILWSSVMDDDLAFGSLRLAPWLSLRLWLLW